jgi:hypothetical protein
MATTYLAEGWCTDPYGRHEARWISHGSPTALVRDGAIEGRDPIGEAQELVEATPILWGDRGADGADLLRSDKTEQSARSAMSHAASSILTRTHD